MTIKITESAPINSYKYMPFKSISPNLLLSMGEENLYYLSGTGFFCKFPPYEYIFYVTAKHCIPVDISGESTRLHIHHKNEYSSEEITKNIIFKRVMGSFTSEQKNEEEDFLVYVVDNDKLNLDNKNSLLDRCLDLPNQEDVDLFLSIAAHSKKLNLRVIGFPISLDDNLSSKTEIDYDKNIMFKQPRGFFGKLKECPEKIEHYFCIDDINWEEGDLRGFSGSPVLYLQQEEEDTIKPIVVGMVTNGGGDKKVAYFIKISIITNAIANFLLSEEN